MIAPDNPASIPLAMLAVFGSAKLLAEVFERLGQPGIVGEIVAGILIGPGVLGWVTPDAFLTALSELGVMFLLYRVGLELKPSELIQVGGTATAVAVSGVVTTFALGWLSLRVWGAPNLEAIFFGAAMVATSVGITAQVLAAKGLLHHRASQLILAAAVIDDVLGLLVLAVVSGLAKGKVNVLEIALTGVLAFGFLIVVAQWGTRTVARVLPTVRKKLRIGEAGFVLGLVLLFSLSLLAVYAGVAAIIGAFIAGMAMAESAGRRIHDLTRGVTELLVPFFLVGVGMHFDPSFFRESNCIFLGITVIVAALVAKFVGCGLAAFRMGRRDAIRVGTGMMPHGEVGMVVAQIGLTAGIVSQPIYGVFVFMAVVTTLVAPPLIRLAYRGVVGETATTSGDDLHIG